MAKTITLPAASRERLAAQYAAAQQAKALYDAMVTGTVLALGLDLAGNHKVHLDTGIIEIAETNAE